MTSHLPHVTNNVVATLNAKHVPFENDLSKTFTDLFDGSLAAFQGFLNDLQAKINADPHLKLAKPFRWKKVPPSPPYTFSTYFLDRSIIELIIGLDSLLDYSPYK